MAFVNEHPQRQALIVVTILFTSISLIVVILRSFARFYILRNPGADDWCMIGAVVCLPDLLSASQR